MTKKEINELDDDCKVCLCMNTTLEEIKTAISEGNDTIEALMDSTEAGTICELCQSLSIDKGRDREFHLDEILSALK